MFFHLCRLRISIPRVVVGQFWSWNRYWKETLKFIAHLRGPTYVREWRVMEFGGFCSYRHFSSRHMKLRCESKPSDVVFIMSNFRISSCLCDAWQSDWRQVSRLLRHHQSCPRPDFGCTLSMLLLSKKVGFFSIHGLLGLPLRVHSYIQGGHYLHITTPVHIVSPVFRSHSDGVAKLWHASWC